MAHKLVDHYREKGARKKLVEYLKERGIGDERVLKALLQMLFPKALLLLHQVKANNRLAEHV